MKKSVLFIVFLFLSQVLSAKQMVGYNYKSLEAEGCNVSFNILRNVDGDYLVVALQSGTIAMTDKPEMKLKFFNGEVITLNGVRQNQAYQAGGAALTGYLFLNSEFNLSDSSVAVSTSIALFPITKEQIEMFPLGVQKIRISSLPIVHEREFKKDKIGAKIYQLYLNTPPAGEF